MTVYPDLAFLIGLALHGGNVILITYSFPLVRPLWQRICYVLFSAILSSLSVLPSVSNAVLVPFVLLVSGFFLRGKTVRGTGTNLFFGFLIFLFRIALTVLCCVGFSALSVMFTENRAYFLVPFFGCLLGMLFSFLLMFVFLRSRKRKQCESAICNCSLTMKGKHVRLRCYVDSGNFLTDAVSGFPVVILEYDVLFRVFGTHFPAPMTYEFASFFGERARVIPLRGISGTGEMLSAFIPDSFLVEGNARSVVVAVTPRRLEGRGRFDGIIGPQLSKGV